MERCMGRCKGRCKGVRVLGQRRLELIAASNQWDAQGSN